MDLFDAVHSTRNTKILLFSAVNVKMLVSGSQPIKYRKNHETFSFHCGTMVLLFTAGRALFAHPGAEKKDTGRRKRDAGPDSTHCFADHSFYRRASGAEN
jgi:hypothetical protein